MKHNLTALIVYIGTLLCHTASAWHSVVDFGAISDNEELWAEQTNANAFNEAILAANYTQDDRVVYVPSGSVFYTMPIYAEYVNNVTFVIDGTIRFSKRHNKWPLRKENTNRDCFALTDVTNITF